MSIFNTIAEYNNHKSWEEMIEAAKIHAIEFKIPPYLNKAGEELLTTEVFNSIKYNGLKLTVEGGIIMLINDVQNTKT